MKTKKMLSKVFALLLALATILSMSVTAFAADSYSITVKNTKSTTNVSIQDKTFNAYKIFDVTYNGNKSYSYTIKNSSSWWNTVIGFLGENVQADGKGVYTGKGLTLTPTASDSGLYNVSYDEDAFSARDFADHLVRNIPANLPEDGTAQGRVAGESGVEMATINLLSPGYYLVTQKSADNDTAVAAAALDTTDPNMTIELKAEAPTVDKVIVENGENTADYNNAAIGDTVKYKVTSKVPDMTGYSKYYFVVTDTMSKGLTLDTDSIKVKINNVEKTKEEHYTVTSTTDSDTGITTLKIVFKNFIQYNTEDYKGKDIEITYSATVNENAVIGAAGNDNTVKLTYSNNPNVTPEGTTDVPGGNDPTGETPDSKVYTYVTGIELTKIDSKTKNRLEGAEFKITGTALKTVLVKGTTYTEDENGTYWKLKDGTYTTDNPNTGVIDTSKYESTATKYTKQESTEKKTVSQQVNATGTVGSDGVLRFDGLAAGEYTITEITAPDGYNLLTSPLTLEIGWEAPADGNTNTTCTWKVETGSDSSWTYDSNTGIFKTTVENSAGSELPSTGGIGTTIFYVIGGILVIGAAVALIVRKRMSGYEE